VDDSCSNPQLSRGLIVKMDRIVVTSQLREQSDILGADNPVEPGFVADRPLIEAAGSFYWSLPRAVNSPVRSVTDAMIAAPRGPESM
jgi:hypothetical protein